MRGTVGEYVLDPAAAFEIVRKTETAVEASQSLAKGLPDTLKDVTGALGASKVETAISGWFTNKARPSLEAASTRADNATGAAHEIIRLLDEADEQMKAQSIDAALENVENAAAAASRGRSRQP